MKKYAILGSGSVGQTLAAGILAQGHEVMIGTHNPNKTMEWQQASLKDHKLASYQDAVAWGDIIILAVKGVAAEEVVKSLAPALAGKIVIDTTNPIAEAEPVNGVLQYFTDLQQSLMEKLQLAGPDAHFVKAFSCTGASTMVKPDFNGEKPSMFICGNDDAAKAEVSSLLTDFGWKIEDMGKVEAARAIEPLAMLWCIPGFLRNDWNHVCKMLRK